MTEREWREVAAEMVLRWPHADIPEETVRVWFTDVEDLPAAQVRAAVRTLARDGREFPPTSGQLRAKVVELAHDHVDHGEAWRLMDEAARRIGHHREALAMKWIAERSPAAAEAARLLGFRDYCLSDVADQSTWRAQHRDIYRGVVTRAQREDAYIGIPGAGLKALEKSNGPRKLGFARALEAGE